MAGMLEEVGTYLAAQGLGLTRGTNLFEGTMPPIPDNCVALLEAPGRAATLGFGVTDGVQYERPGLIVWVRGAKHVYATPRDLAHNIRQKLALVQALSLSGTVYHLIQPMQSPFVLEVDEADERKVFACNYGVEKEPS